MSTKPRAPTKSWSELSVYVDAATSPFDASTPPPTGRLLDEFMSGGIEVTEENAAEHFVWVQQEVDRFNRFVVQQLDLIRRSREEIARTDSQVTAAYITRNQELNREKAIVAARASTLKKLEADRAEEFARQRERLTQRIAEIDRIEATMQRKLAEIEEIEETLRTELEERERELEQQRRMVEEAVRELRSRPHVSTVAASTDSVSFPCG
jgi:DNA repair exonuclease SbcCD ATPase subunit